MQVIPYDRACAVSYAAAWALGRNPMYYDFSDIGGDCTNFVSQCLYAGGKQMNFAPVFGWYYLSASDRTASWTGVEYLWNFVVANTELGPFGEETDRAALMLGDFVQLGNRDGYYHTPIVTGFAGGMPLVSAHSYDVYNKPLDSYTYERIRYMHVLGVRVREDYNRDELRRFGVIRDTP